MSFSRISLLAALAGISLLAPSLALADWGPAVPVTGAHEDAYTLGVAANAQDRPAVLFQKRHGRDWTLALRRTDRGGRLGAPTVLLRSRHQVEGGGLFAGPGSDLVAGWLEIVNGSRRPVVATGSHLQRRQVLAPGPRSTQILRIAANRRGDAVVAFWRYNASTYSIYAAFRRAGERFGTPQPIETGNVSFSSLAIDQHGAAAVGWTDQQGVHVALRRAGGTAFDSPALVAAMGHLRGDPGLALDGDHVVVSWMTEDIDGNRALLVSESTAGARFSAPVTLSTPGAGLPRWFTPGISVNASRVAVAWVQGSRYTVSRDAATLAIKPAGRTWGAPTFRRVRAPAHVYAVSILDAAPGRPALLGLTSSRSYRFQVATATLRSGGRLGPVRFPATGRTGGFRPYLAQGGRHTWLVTERDIGQDRLQRRQVLLFRSN